MSDNTTTTYYVHSTVLGGKTIAELDQYGVKTGGYVYAGGARVATQTVYGSSNAVQIESTNPVTGATIVTDANGSSAARQEPDPLGRELSQAPDPTVAEDPLASSKWSDPMPIEASWRPSAEYEQANAGRAAEMDAYEAEKALFYKFRATWEWILHKNPNVGVRISSGGRTSYGDAATSALLKAGNDRLDNPFVISEDPSYFTEPQNYVSPTIKELKDSFYKKYRADIDRCIKKVFGTDYALAFGFNATETVKTSPSVNLSLTQKQLGKMTGVPDADGAPDGPNHAIYISKEAWHDPANALNISDRLYRIYAHELGNEVSFDISGSYMKYGDRKGIGATYKDKDTGAKFEKCMFGNVQF